MHLAVSSIIEPTTRVGEGTKIGYFCHVKSNCLIGKDCFIDDAVNVGHNTIIGDRVKIGTQTVFSGTEARSKLNKRDEPGITVIEDDVIIGSKVTIVGGTKIKKGSVIADGSTVIGYVWPQTFVAGNPARRIYSLSAING